MSTFKKKNKAVKSIIKKKKWLNRIIIILKLNKTSKSLKIIWCHLKKSKNHSLYKYVIKV